MIKSLPFATLLAGIISVALGASFIGSKTMATVK
ncbi:unnamed protein product, partial [Rotaria sp. Silwood2]